MYSEYFNILNKLDEQYLTESSELYSGIFWIVDLDNINNNRKYVFPFPCDSYGNPISDIDMNVGSKNGQTYNHERVWSYLPKELTHNKSFDYYPRGRVQIANGKAIVYLNPNIDTEEVHKFIIDEFNLTTHNGINRIVFNVDGSNHYKCYLDR